MCGTAGVRKLLMGMAAQLFHRGADDSGVWAEGLCGLAHTRSSIIDIAASRQPIVDADGHAHLVFNGEISELP